MIPNFLAVIITNNDHFIKDLLEEWSKDKKLLRYDFYKRESTLLKRFINSIKNLIIIKRVLEDSNYKIIFFEWGSALLRQITRIFQITKPAIARIHRYELYEKYFSRINFNKIDKIILVSKFMKEEFIKKFPKLGHKLVIIPNSIRLDKFYPPENKAINYKICTLSGINQVKRLDLVIDAMKYVKNPKVRLHIGGTGEMENRLKKKVKQENLQGKVFFDGRIDAVRQWFEDKDLIINSSDIESFGVALIEGMACEVIPLIRGWGAANELFPKEFVLPYNEQEFVENLAHRIDEFYEKNYTIQNFQRTLVREYVKKHYPFENQLQKFDDLFTSLLKNKQIQSYKIKKTSGIRWFFSLITEFLIEIADFFFSRIFSKK